MPRWKRPSIVAIECSVVYGTLGGALTLSLFVRVFFGLTFNRPPYLLLFEVLNLRDKLCTCGME